MFFFLFFSSPLKCFSWFTHCGALVLLLAHLILIFTFTYHSLYIVFESVSYSFFFFFFVYDMNLTHCSVMSFLLHLALDNLNLRSLLCFCLYCKVILHYFILHWLNWTVAMEAFQIALCWIAWWDTSCIPQFLCHTMDG